METSPYPIFANPVKLVVDASIGLNAILQEHNSLFLPA